MDFGPRMTDFFLRFFFDVAHFLKSLLNLSQYRFCFMSWLFGTEAHGILAPQPGTEPVPPAVEGKILISGPPGRSLFCFC